MTITRQQMLDHLESRMNPRRYAEGGAVERKGALRRYAEGSVDGLRRMAQTVGRYVTPRDVASIVTPGGGLVDAATVDYPEAIDAFRDGRYGDAAISGGFGALNQVGDALSIAGPVGIAAGAGIKGATRAAKGIRAYHGSPHDFPAERLVRTPDGQEQFIVGAPDRLPDVPESASVLQDYPLGRFRLDKIGTGEGAQAYGHGLYKAEAESVAKSYRDALHDARLNQARYAGRPLSELDADLQKKIRYNFGGYASVDDALDAQRDQIRRYASDPSEADFLAEEIARMQFMEDTVRQLELPSGRMYEVQINADPSRFLDWDAPLRRQSPEVQEMLQRGPGEPAWRGEKDYFDRFPSDFDRFGDYMGGDAYRRIAGDEFGQDMASGALRKAGIPGIKYRDDNSRNWRINTEDGSKWEVGNSATGEIREFATRDEAAKFLEGKVTRNYVVFDDSLITILRKYGVGSLAALPAGVLATIGISRDQAEEMDANRVDAPQQYAEGGMVRSGRGALGAIYDAARSMFSPGGELNPTGPLIEPTAEGVMGAVDFAGEMLTPGPGIEEGMRRMSSARDSYRDGNYLDAAGNAMTGVLEAGMDIPQLGIFAGAGARTANRLALEQAKELAEAGADRRAIWDETGWFKGPDGQWRFEIDDSASRFDASAADARMPSRLNVAQERFAEQTGLPKHRMLNGRPEDEAAKTEALRWADENLGRLRDEVTGASLSRVLPHDDLYRAYPDMAEIGTARETLNGLGGTHNNNRITYGGETLMTRPDNRSVLLHEGQHAVQAREGFGRGGSPSDFSNVPTQAANDAWKSLHSVLRGDTAMKLREVQGDFKAIMEIARSDPDGYAAVSDALNTLQATNFSAADDALAALSRKIDEVPTPMQQYRRLAGEVEARNVQTRRDFTPEERRARPPWETQDVPDDLQIVRMGSDGPQMSVDMPPPRNAAERQADDIAAMLREGRAGDVTDEMMSAADPQRLAKLYDDGLTGADMPMDTASRMGRAEGMGFDENVYHGTGSGGFSEFSTDRSRIVGSTYSDVDPSVASAYAKYGDSPQVYPLMMRADNPERFDLMSWEPMRESGALQRAMDQGHDAYYARDGRRIAFDPANIRSRFARFDPRLSHLRNLNAGLAPIGIGTIGALPLLTRGDE